MRPESHSPWPHVERLEQVLARQGLTIGVMERVRLEYVLRDAGVPEGEAPFVGYVDEDPERFRRLVTATLAKSSAQREAVTGAYAGWVAGLPREALPERVRDHWVSSPVNNAPSAALPEMAQARSSRGVGVLLMLLLAVGFGGWWAFSVEKIDEGARGTNTNMQPGEDTGESPERGDAGESKQGADTVHKKSGGGESMPLTLDYMQAGGEPPDLSGVEVAVPWPVLVSVPRAWVAPPPVPWSMWIVGVLSMVVFGLTWAGTRRRTLLPPPAVRTGRGVAGRVQPELDRGALPAFVQRSEQDTLIWGIGREVSERHTEQLDARRTIDATIARGGLPELWFEHAFEHRGVWLWRDRRMKSGQVDAKRLAAEIVQTLEAAELPVHEATFARVPDTLQKVDGPTFSPHELDEQRRTARVVVLTDGHGLLRARTARSQSAVRDLLRRLQGWHALAVVVFGDHVGEVEQLLEPFGIPCLAPADAVAHLAGALREGSGVERERELLRWEMACGLAPRRIRAEDALALRNALELQIEGFAVDAIRQRYGRGRHLVWSAEQRATTVADYDRAFGYLAMGWDAVDERALIGRALAFWREYYERALAEQEPGSMTQDYLRIEQLVLALWDRPEEAVRGRDREEGLYALFQIEALEPVVRELVAQYTDHDGPADRVRLPWSYAERPIDVQVMLGRMGFAAEETASRVQRAGRWGWGLGMALGVGVMALSGAMMQTLMPGEAEWEPSVTWVGPQVPEDERWSECDEEANRCFVASRFSHGSAQVPEGGTLEVEWAAVKRPCEERGEIDGDPALWLRCTTAGRLVERPPGRPQFSAAVLQAAVDDDGAYRLGRLLLDTGSADTVVIMPKYGWTLPRSETLGFSAASMDGIAQGLWVGWTWTDAKTLESVPAGEALVLLDLDKRPAIDLSTDAERPATDFLTDSEYYSRALSTMASSLSRAKGLLDVSELWNLTINGRFTVVGLNGLYRGKNLSSKTPGFESPEPETSGRRSPKAKLPEPALPEPASAEPESLGPAAP